MPDTSQAAGLMLKLYELRTEATLRQARAWFAFEFHPSSARDVLSTWLGPGHESAPYRMVTTYWDMACSFVATGVLHPDLFFQSAGEAFMVWSRVESYAPRVRADLQTPWFLVNMETAIGMVSWGQERLAIFRARLAAMREKAQKAGKPS